MGWDELVNSSYLGQVWLTLPGLTAGASGGLAFLRQFILNWFISAYCDI